MVEVDVILQILATCVRPTAPLAARNIAADASEHFEHFDRTDRSNLTTKHAKLLTYQSNDLVSLIQ